VAAKSAAPRATYADLEAVPANKVAEIINGVLIVNPRPALPHAAAATAISEELGPPFKRSRGGPGGWVILYEPELHLGPEPDVLVPDLAGWRRERMPERPDTPFTRLAPDWVCEILSPSTAAVDRGEKLPIYARESVRHAWLVDPAVHTLEVLRLEREAWRIVATWHDDAKVRAEPFDAIELDLGILWAR
jgi:Uma2 family endonuclease